MVVPVAVCISGSVIRVRGETASPLSLSGKTTCYVKVDSVVILVGHVNLSLCTKYHGSH